MSTTRVDDNRCAETDASGDQPLAGVTIVDFSRVLAGPLATMLLSDHGATVVKVERPDGGDDTRSWGPPHDSMGVATYFLAVNRGKRSLVLDLTDDADLAVAKNLVEAADVVVENFRTGVMDRLGLGYREIAERNPGVIYCSITGFGNKRGGTRAGYDLLVQAVGGLMSMTGASDGSPQKVGVALVDVMAGLFAANGVLMALRQRDRDGLGQHVTIDLLSVLLAGMVNQSAAYTVCGQIPTRMGNDHPSIAPYSTFATATGELVLAVGTDRQFETLCEELGISEFSSDARFATNAARVGNRSILRDVLEGRLCTRSADEWEARLIARGVPAGKVNQLDDAFALAERLDLDPLVSLTRADGSTIKLPRSPIGLSRTPAKSDRPPPALGDTDVTSALGAVRSTPT